MIPRLAKKGDFSSSDEFGEMANNPQGTNPGLFPNDPINSGSSLFHDLDQHIFSGGFNTNQQRMMPSIPQAQTQNDIPPLILNQHPANNNNNFGISTDPDQHQQMNQAHMPQTHFLQNSAPQTYQTPPPAQLPSMTNFVPQHINDLGNQIQYPGQPQGIMQMQRPMPPQYPQMQQQKQPMPTYSNIHTQQIQPQLTPQIQQHRQAQIPQIMQAPLPQITTPMQHSLSHPQIQSSLPSQVPQNQRQPQPQIIQMPNKMQPPMKPVQGQLPQQVQFPQSLMANVAQRLQINNPMYFDLLKNLRANPNMIQPYLNQMNLKKQSASRAKNTVSTGDDFITDDDDADEVVDDLPSSEEAEFSSSSEDETDFESLPDDYVPEGNVERRTTTREHKKTIHHDDSETYFGAEEEDIQENEQAIISEDLLEHIYMSRVQDGGLEYLVRFQESPPALCHWIPEILVMQIPNAKGHLERFRSAPFGLEDIPDGSDYLYPVAHRREKAGDKPELLFRFSYDNTVLFYWDFADEKTMKKYFDSRVRIDSHEPTPPEELIAKNGELPEPTDTTIVSDSNDKMRSYQVDGLKWLLKCWRDHHGSILADEMGLGKTIQLLSFLSYLIKNTDWKGPYLIAVRTNTFKQWCDEITKWTDLQYLPYNSGPAQRSIMREHQFPALDELGNPIPNTFSFHIFLVSYDVLLKDVEFIRTIPWQVLVVDEGHRIKNSQGKKNNAMSSVNSFHRIILTGTPIQNSLKELWALLRFVSPDIFEEDPEFLESELEEMTSEQVMETRNMIQPHLLRRSLQDVEHSIAPKDERVAFVSLTDVQKDLIRLTKMHKLWRLKGVQTSEEEMDASNEGNAILKICSHPFLLPEAEEYYSKRMKMKRVDLLLAVSAKFQWLDHLLCVLKKEGHRVLIFSQRVELLRLLNEFCKLRGYITELLIGSMSDSDKTSAIERFSSNNSKAFIFLISTRAGSEGLNLTVANTAIIFDPDWNPQNDLQAQARCHRIGQTQKVDVLRLITFQTYEHDMFVRAQRKLGLWLTLLGTKSIEEVQASSSHKNVFKVEKPPEISQVPIDENLSLNDALHSVSTIVHDFSLDCLSSLEDPLKETISYSNGKSDEEFIEQFPVSLDAGTRRTKHSRSRDLLLDFNVAMKAYKLMEKYGYGEWETITRNLPEEHSSEQIRRFCVCLTVFAFRAMQPTNITYLPVLASKVIVEEPDFNFEMLLCSNKHAWSQVFPEDHDYALEVDSCKRLRDELKEHSFAFLSIIEMKLIAKRWCCFNQKDTFDINSLMPPVTDNDEELYRAIMNDDPFDPFDLRVQAIINKMRSDIITARLDDDFGMKFQWWTAIEYNNVMSVLKNYPYESNDFTLFHAKTTILSKTTEEIELFTCRLMKLLNQRIKGSIVIPKDMHMMKLAPKVLQNAKGFTSWANILVRECEDIVFRFALIEAIQHKLTTLNDTAQTENWSDFYTKQFLNALLQYGIDSMTDLLIDRRFGFKKFVSESDLEFIKGNKKRRNAASSQLPEFLFSEDELYAYLKGERGDFLPDDGLVQFNIPIPPKLNFEPGPTPNRKKVYPAPKIHNLADDYAPRKSRHPRKYSSDEFDGDLGDSESDDESQEEFAPDDF